VCSVNVASYASLEPFTTKDGSEIRKYLHTAVQSLAEATLVAGVNLVSDASRII
jgi:hypothetical protein